MAMNHFHHKIILELHTTVDEVAERVKWCIDTFGNNKDVWYHQEVECILRSKGEIMPEFAETKIKTDAFFFADEDDAVMFKLTWGGYYVDSSNAIKCP